MSLFEFWSQVLASGLVLGAVYALFASGMTLMYAVSKQINVVHGDLMVLCLWISWLLIKAVQFEPYVSLIITVPVMLLLGIGMWKFLFVPLVEAHHLLLFQGLLGIVFIIEGIYLNLLGADIILATTSFTGTRQNIGFINLTTGQVIACTARCSGYDYAVRLVRGHTRSVYGNGYVDDAGFLAARYRNVVEGVVGHVVFFLRVDCGSEHRPLIYPPLAV